MALLFKTLPLFLLLSVSSVFSAEQTLILKYDDGLDAKFEANYDGTITVLSPRVKVDGALYAFANNQFSSRAICALTDFKKVIRRSYNYDVIDNFVFVDRNLQAVVARHGRENRVSKVTCGK